MSDPLSLISTRASPQDRPADDRQVPNSAGGYAFTVTAAARLHRFLTLGTEGGTYYASEREITAKNAAVVLRMAREDAAALTAAVVAVSRAGRAPRNNPALFALAAAASLGDDDGRRAALDALPLVARTGTHLFLFGRYVQQFRGWGRGLRRAVGDWYLAKDPGDLAYQVLKYRQREGWAHRDMLRLAHPAGTGTHRALFDWICGREADLADLPLVRAYTAAQVATTVAAWVALIGEHRSLSWEMLPDAALTEPDVWRALLAGGLPQTALMRQLPRLTRLGVVGPADLATTKAVATRLADRDRLVKARVHPVSVLLALRTYASGHGARGSGEWTPAAAITDALDAAFYAAFAAVEPAGKRTLLALDVSGSMTQAVSGLPLTCREASAALALVTAATESYAFVGGFTAGAGGFTPLDISPRQRLDDAIGKVSGLPFGGTDCALPMLWAAEHGLEIDHYSVYTDNETWAGQVHPHQALRAYREKTGIDARLSVVGMTATNFTIADPDDPGTLDVSGFDSAVPSLLADFARGDI
jgi:60 kDa SS-A/Ro ribonucleoprotein